MRQIKGNFRPKVGLDESFFERNIVMKKLIFMTLLLGLIATPALAVINVPSDVWWDIYDPGSTYQDWDFTADYVDGSAGTGWTATPEEMYNPYADDVVLASISAEEHIILGDSFKSEYTPILVELLIPNYDESNPYKELWVVVQSNVAPTNIEVDGIPSGDFTSIPLDPDDILETDWIFGYKIIPNPAEESISFTIPIDPRNGYACLEGIRVDTICIPEPGSILLVGVGISILRRKRTL